MHERRAGPSRASSLPLGGEARSAGGAPSIDDQSYERRVGRTIVYLLWVVVMAYGFANAEIQIEGPAGWAANLPTWRIEKHWLLDLFWGGRAMTGYHAWVFPFMAMVFFAPLAFNGRFTWRDAALALVGLIVFWIAEDFMWFIVNPAYGWPRFNPIDVPWHKHWLFGAPVDYWVGLGVAALILFVRHRRRVHVDQRARQQQQQQLQQQQRRGTRA